MLKPYFEKLKTRIDLLELSLVSFRGLADLSLKKRYTLRERILSGRPVRTDKGWWNKPGCYEDYLVKFRDFDFSDREGESVFIFGLIDRYNESEFTISLEDKDYETEWVILEAA